ncbi:MAG: hypothetical protein ACHREM_00060 [Polyangiales bacterium]
MRRIVAALPRRARQALPASVEPRDDYRSAAPIEAEQKMPVIATGNSRATAYLNAVAFSAWASLGRNGVWMRVMGYTGAAPSVFSREALANLPGEEGACVYVVDENVHYRFVNALGDGTTGRWMPQTVDTR